MKTCMITNNNNSKSENINKCFWQKIVQKDIKKVKNTIILWKQIILKVFIFISLLKKCHFPNIIIKTRGEGDKNVFTSFDEFNNELYPDKVSINEINSQYYLNEEENIIKLNWTNNINKINYVFRDYYDIGEIDISDFDFSVVSSMESLFNNCISLTSIIYPNNILFNSKTQKQLQWKVCLKVNILNILI